MPTEQPAQPVHPSAPTRPLEVDLARVALGGMVLWAVGLLVTVLLAVRGRTGWTPVGGCVTGLVLGVADALRAGGCGGSRADPPRAEGPRLSGRVRLRRLAEAHLGRPSRLGEHRLQRPSP